MNIYVYTYMYMYVACNKLLEKALYRYFFFYTNDLHKTKTEKVRKEKEK